MSHTRLCGDCARELLIDNSVSIKLRKGAPFLHWRRQMAASVGGVLLDDVIPRK